MDKDKIRRLNALRKKLREWENQGYNVSPLKKDIEAFERQEGIRHSIFPRVALITLLILVVIGVGVGIGVNYHKKQIAIQEKLRQAEEEKKKLQEKLKQEEARKKREEKLKQAKRAKKRKKKGLVYLRTNSKGYREYKNVKDGSILIYIPAGEFTMGSNNGDYDEKPVHKVYLDGYYIGKYEVTFAQYDKFCEATGRKKPDDEGWGRGNRPVINVSWDDAVTYCKWAGLRLPTEAEWEKAARGTDGRKYPWGNREPTSSLANYNKNVGRTKDVGSYPDGISPYGCYDMAGNVWEWCSDWYGEKYYRDSPYKNPRGPNSGDSRIIRGGSCYDDARVIRCANRLGDTPLDYNVDLGFRVAR